MEYACGNIFIRQMVLEKAGDVVRGHKHNFDHTTYCAHGAMLIESLNDDGTTKDSTEIDANKGFNWALILAGVEHRITALRDSTIGHCIYAHMTPQGKIVQKYTGWAPAYE